MFSIRLFFACRVGIVLLFPFSLSTLIYVFMFFMCICFNLPFLILFDLIYFAALFPAFFDYCVHTVTVQCILLTHSLKEGPLWRSGRPPAGWVLGYQREKLKAIPFIVRFPLFLLGESRAHRTDSEHGALLLSRITTGNVFPCDVTVNNFSAKGNKSVDFGAVCTFLGGYRGVYSQKYIHILHIQSWSSTCSCGGFTSQMSSLRTVFSYCVNIHVKQMQKVRG